MVRRFVRRMHAIFDHPGMRLATALVLLASGLDDLVEGITGSEGFLNLDVSHGVVLIAIQHVLKSASEFLERAEKLEEALHMGHRVAD